MNFKKIIASFLCSSMMGSLIRFFFSKYKYKGGVEISFRTPNISTHSIASLFWGFYEKAEANFIVKYLHIDKDVVELGASVGVVSSIIAKKINKNKKVVCVEPNPKFKKDIENNLQLNQLENFQIISKAYSSKAEVVLFETADYNIAGKVILAENHNSSNKVIEVPSISLSGILEEGNIKEEFVLVSDVEGAEVELFLNEQEALNKCKQIIIETHSTDYNGKKYVPEQIKEIIGKHGFELIDARGPVLVFEKR